MRTRADGTRFNAVGARSIRRLVVAGALGATLHVGSPSPAGADSPERVSATSPRTGVSYSGIYSCASGKPTFVMSHPTQRVEIELEEIRADNTTASLVRRDWSPLSGGFFVPIRFGFGGINGIREDGSRFVVRDRLPGDTNWVDVIELPPADCPDYAAGEVTVYEGVTATRVIDTRPAFLTNHTGGKPGPGSVLTIPAANMPNRPAGTVAVALTVSMVAPEARGFAQVFPTGDVTPGFTANVNVSAAGEVAGNLAVSPVGSDGSVSIFTSAASHIVADITGYYVEVPGGTATAGRLETIVPQRMLDTRPAEKINSDGTRPAAGSTTTLDLTTLGSGLPPGATAAVVNVTATGAAAQGFVQVAAAGDLVPGASAVVNVGPGQTKGGLTIVPVDEDGKIDIFVESATNVIVDMSGWFTGDTADDSDSGLFVPLAPERILDTRPESHVNFATPGGATLIIGLYDEQIGIPVITPLASAILINATTINPDAAGFAQIKVQPDRLTSTVNFTEVGSTVANASIVPLGANPSVAWPFGTALRNADIAVDMSGYFTI